MNDLKDNIHLPATPVKVNKKTPACLNIEKQDC